MNCKYVHMHLIAVNLVNDASLIFVHGISIVCFNIILRFIDRLFYELTFVVGDVISTAPDDDPPV